MIDLAKLQARLDDVVASGETPGAQLAVSQHGERASVASGVLNLRTGEPARTDSLFQLGSITKVWTATLVMQLVDEGRFDLDAPVRDVLPGLDVGSEGHSANVTGRHLLTHTSGIRGDLMEGDTGLNDDALETFVGLLAAEPPSYGLGATWSYCNSGFDIAGRIIEVLDGTTFEAALRRRLATPLDLPELSFDAGEAILWGAAVGHMRGPDGTLQVTPRYGLPRAAAPSGGVILSADSLLAFAELHLADGRTAAGEQLLSEASTRAMRERHADLPVGHARDSWGLGWGRHDWSGGTVLAHSGDMLGQHAELYLVPEARLAITMTINGPGGHADRDLVASLLDELAGISMPAAPTPPDPPAPLPDPAPYVGSYGREDALLTVEPAPDGGLQVRQEVSGPIAEALGLIDLPPFPMIPTGEPHEFLISHDPDRGVWQEVNFQFAPEGEPAAFLHAGLRAQPRRT